MVVWFRFRLWGDVVASTVLWFELAHVDTDGEVGTMEGRDSAFDAAAFKRAFVTLVERGGRRASKDEGGGGATHGMRVVESEI